jgi:hypothetical protein
LLTSSAFQVENLLELILGVETLAFSVLAQARADLPSWLWMGIL